MPIKTFRGLMGDDTQERISLKHRDGRIGYRIVKFETIPNIPGSTGVESIMKIYKTSQTAQSVTVDFSDQTLLGVSYYQDDANVAYPSSQDIIFDGEIFNQDIYITLKQGAGSHSMNYYLELEQIPINSLEATAATLKNMRNTSTQTAG
jgi:hypothetical protein